MVIINSYSIINLYCIFNGLQIFPLDYLLSLNKLIGGPILKPTHLLAFNDNGILNTCLVVPQFKKLGPPHFAR